jgi:hypothetical protein
MAHDPRPFNRTDPLAMRWTERAYELLQSGELSADVISADGVRVVRVDGNCPYCDDHVHYVEPLTAVTEGMEGVLGSTRGSATPPREPRYEEITVTCGCSESHPGNPTESTGCGTSFRIAILLDE